MADAAIVNDNKAKLQIVDKEYKDKDKNVNFQFNPEKYSISKSITWRGKKKSPQLQFKNQGRKVLSFDLLFDTYESGEDVRTKTKKIMRLATPIVKIKPGKYRPPICLFTWGKVNFKGIIESVTQNFTLFLFEGIPVRARLQIKMKQFYTTRGKSKGTPPGDPEQIRIVKQGDTLFNISADEYGRPDLWRHIAKENNITHPRKLQPGQTLIIPAIE